MWSSPKLLKSLVETDRYREGEKVNKSENKDEKKDTKLWVIQYLKVPLKFKLVKA